jgi:hypothetical protein
MTDVSERWNSFICDSRGCYLVNDPEITFQDHEEAEAYCDEHNRALAGQMVMEESAKIVAWLHEAGYRQIADKIEAKEYL